MAVDRRGTEILKLVELVDRHELYAVDTQFEQVRYLLDDTCKGALVLDARSCATSEIAHVHLVNDEVVNGRFKRQVFLPVVIVEHHAGTIGVDTVPIRFFAPHIATYNEFGVGVEQYLRLIETMAFFGTERSVHPIAVLDVFVIEVEHHHGENVTQSELLKERNLDKRFFLVVFKEHEGTLGSVA